MVKHKGVWDIFEAWDNLNVQVTLWFLSTRPSAEAILHLEFGREEPRFSVCGV